MGAFGYADDLILLCPTKEGLRKMIRICESYASEHDILFNGSKSNLLVFGSVTDIRPIIKVNDILVPVCDIAVHLGNIISKNVSDVIEAGISKFNTSFNYFMATYGKCQSSVKNKLFVQYCTSFYGSQIWPLYHKDGMRKVCVAWRKALRRIWKLPGNTHCDILPLLSSQNPIDIQLKCRFVKFYKSLVISENNLIRYLSHASTFTSYSTMSKNLNQILYDINFELEELLHLSINNIKKIYYDNWIRSINKQYIIHSSVIHELCLVKEGILVSELEFDECDCIIQSLCTL